MRLNSTKTLFACLQRCAVRLIVQNCPFGLRSIFIWDPWYRTPIILYFINSCLDARYNWPYLASGRSERSKRLHCGSVGFETVHWWVNALGRLWLTSRSYMIMPIAAVDNVRNCNAEEMWRKLLVAVGIRSVESWFPVPNLVTTGQLIALFEVYYIPIGTQSAFRSLAGRGFDMCSSCWNCWLYYVWRMSSVPFDPRPD